MVYYSTAETLPHHLIESTEQDERHEPTMSSLSVRRRLVEDIIDSSCIGPLQQSRVPAGLTVRHLPPGRVSDLYLLYLGTCFKDGSKPGSATHFRRVWKNGWRKALVFRKASTHSLCRICHALKTEMRHAPTLQAHIAACDRNGMEMLCALMEEASAQVGSNVHAVVDGYVRVCVSM